jgi:hypothetical protein
LVISAVLGLSIVLDELFLIGFSMWLGFPLVFGLLGALMLSVLATPFMLHRATREVALATFCGALTFVAVAVAALHLHNDARMIAFGRVAQDAEPLVDALNDFAAREGRPPGALEELIPEYLDQVPSASHGLGNFHYQQYALGLTATDVDTAEHVAPAPWSLLVHCGRGMLNWDVFVYWPGEQYPNEMYGGYVERVGRWAYVHE